MGPGRRHTRSAGIISGTGVQKWTRPVNSLPYLTLPRVLFIGLVSIFISSAVSFYHNDDDATMWDDTTTTTRSTTVFLNSS